MFHLRTFFPCTRVPIHHLVFWSEWLVLNTHTLPVLNEKSTVAISSNSIFLYYLKLVIWRTTYWKGQLDWTLLKIIIICCEDKWLYVRFSYIYIYIKHGNYKHKKCWHNGKKQHIMDGCLHTKHTHASYYTCTHTHTHTISWKMNVPTITTEEEKTKENLCTTF